MFASRTRTWGPERPAAQPRAHSSAAAALLTVLAAACARSPGTPADVPPTLPALARADHQTAQRTWNQQRAASLVQPGQPLSYTGLTWLHPGENVVGADSASAVRLTGRGVPARVGTLVREGTRVRFVPAVAVAVRVDSQPLASGGPLRTDADSGGATRVEIGSAGFRIVRRLDSLGVRSWDAERESVRRFDGLTLFPLDSAWRVAGRLAPLAAPRHDKVMTEAGVLEEQVVVGTVRATIAGAPYALTAYEGGRPNELFLVFTDATSGDETYGFRFLRAARDTATNAVTLDFNFAYNPDCAFTPYATCPLPPPENRIRTAIRAGERRYGHDATVADAR